MLSLIRTYLNLTPSPVWAAMQMNRLQHQYASCNPYCTSFSVRWQSAFKYLCSILNIVWCRASILCHRCARNWSSLCEHFIIKVSLHASSLSNSLPLSRFHSSKIRRLMTDDNEKRSRSFATTLSIQRKPFNSNELMATFSFYGAVCKTHCAKTFS